MANILKPRKKGLINTIIGFVLGFLTFGATITAATFAGIDGKLGNNFKSSYNLRYEFDPYKVSEDPTVPALERDYYQTSEKQKELEDNVKNMAHSFSTFLLDRGISNGNVYPEITKDDTGLFHVYLNATVDIAKVTTSDHSITEKDRNNVDITKANAYFNNMFANRFTILYNDGYTTKENETKSSSNNLNDDEKSIKGQNNFRQSKFYTWSINDFGDDSLVDDNDRITANYTTNTINIHLKDGFSFGKFKDDDKKEYVDNSVKENFYKAKENKDTNDDTKTERYPFMWIIRDFRGMLNKLQYIYYTTSYYKGIRTNYNKQSIDQQQINSTWFQMSSGVYSEQGLLSDITGDSHNKETQRFLNSTKDGFNAIQFADGAGFQENSIDKLNTKKNFKLTDQDIANYQNPYTAQGKLLNSYLLAFIQGWDTYQALDSGSDADTYLPNPGTNQVVKYEFLKPYVLGVVTKTNYTDFLPDKNPTRNTLDSDGEWLSIKNEGKYFTTKELYRQLTTEKFAYPLMDVINPTNGAKDNYKFFATSGFGKTNNQNVDVINNYVDGSIAVNTPVVTSLITLVFIALLIGLIISVLYRVPGFVMFLMQILPVALSFLLLFTFGYTLSITMILAAIVGLMASNVSAIHILNKLKKNYLLHKTLDQAVFSAYSTSFFSCLDPFAITFILGACLLFFPSGQLFYFGISLILLSGLSFLTIYLGSWLINAFIFNNGYGMFKYQYLSSIKIDDNLVSVDKKYTNSYRTQATPLIEKGFDKDGYISRINFKHPLIFSKLFNFSSLTILALLIIVGFVLLFVIGPTSSFTFYGGSRLMIYANNDQMNLTKIFAVLTSIGFKQSDWHNIISNSSPNGYIYLETSITLTTDQISAIKTQLHAFVQTIDPTISLQLTYHAVYALLTFFGLNTIYTLLRHKWYYIVPVLITNIIIIASVLGLFFLTFISFNTFIAYGALIVTLMLNWVIYGFINSINDKWGNNYPITYSELILKIKYGYMNYYENYLVIIISWLIVGIIGLIFMPQVMLSVFILMLMGLVLIALGMNSWFSYLIYFFTNLKNIRKNRINQINSNLSVRNLDKIDEELINTINVNTKVITE